MNRQSWAPTNRYVHKKVSLPSTNSYLNCLEWWWAVMLGAKQYQILFHLRIKYVDQRRLLTRRTDSFVWRFCLWSWILDAMYRLWKGKSVFFSRPTYLTATHSLKSTVSLAQETFVPRSYSILLSRIEEANEKVQLSIRNDAEHFWLGSFGGLFAVIAQQSKWSLLSCIPEEGEEGVWRMGSSSLNQCQLDYVSLGGSQELFTVHVPSPLCLSNVVKFSF
jgi:hypothetical protein